MKHLTQDWRCKCKCKCEISCGRSDPIHWLDCAVRTQGQNIISKLFTAYMWIIQKEKTQIFSNTNFHFFKWIFSSQKFLLFTGPKLENHSDLGFIFVRSRKQQTKNNKNLVWLKQFSIFRAFYMLWHTRDTCSPMCFIFGVTTFSFAHFLRHYLYFWCQLHINMWKLF